MQQSVTASSAAAAAAPSWGASTQSDLDRRFRSAVRHSRMVHLLRRGIPALCAIALLVLVAIWLNPFRNTPMPAAKINTSTTVSGSKITMELPRLAGFTRDSRAYEFNAHSASQDIKNPNLVELTKLRAKVEMDNKTVVEMTAPQGIYDSSSERLTLGAEILFKSSSGHEGRLREAVVDVRGGQIVSNSPVELKFLNGTLNANRLDMGRNGEVIRFENGVTMNLNMGKQDSGPAEPEAK